jgi:hypothetical protein
MYLKFKDLLTVISDTEQFNNILMEQLNKINSHGYISFNTSIYLQIYVMVEIKQ